MGKRTNTAVWLDKYNRWQIKVQKEGERRTFTCSTPGRTGQRKCNAKADAWLDDNIVASKLQPLYDTWIEELKLITSKSHWSQYEWIGRTYIIPDYGNKKLDSVTEQMMQNILMAAHRKGLAHKTLKNIRACIVAFLKFARKNGTTKLYPENLYIPKGAPKIEKRAMHIDSVKKLFRCDLTLRRGKIEPEIFVNMWRLGVVTGLRPGELLGLQWDDIKDDTLYIQRSYNVHQEMTAGKNKNARRAFALHKTAMLIIEKQKMLLAQQNIDTAFIFPDDEHDLPCQKRCRNRWKIYADFNDIEYVAPYELRHTFVTLARSLSDDDLRMLVGHSDSMDTKGTYAHETEADRLRIRQKLDALFAQFSEGGL